MAALSDRYLLLAGVNLINQIFLSSGHEMGTLTCNQSFPVKLLYKISLILVPLNLRKILRVRAIRRWKAFHTPTAKKDYLYFRTKSQQFGRQVIFLASSLMMNNYHDTA